MPALSRLTRSYERAFKHHPSLTLAITNGCLKCLGDFLAQYLPAFSSGLPFVLDGHRSLRFFLFGFMHGPCVGKWHEFLERRIPLTAPRGGGGPTDAEQDLQLAETEKSLTSLRPVSMRSRSTAADHVPTLRALSTSEAQLLPPPGDHAASKHKSAAGFRLLGLLKRILLDQLLMAPIYTFLFISLTGWFEGLTIPEIQERLHQLYWYLLTANWKVIPSIPPLHPKLRNSCVAGGLVLKPSGIDLAAYPDLQLQLHASPIPSAMARLLRGAVDGLLESEHPLLDPPQSQHSRPIRPNTPSDPAAAIKRKNNRVIG
ncbi:hypothetical protein PtA15_1A786 [Puccinia triticina]|uniref:Uncharacterized protein n=1 Tax=Puccinia triticina TaxID=208348 RepID=A0ABY7C8E6_9BASI|nr:uncharacterized protein PtA15_1A786 [Puccinia triticina]WAQ81445.1 hypothetical protein PtA15_1A786 [Puccinia triticina]